MFSYFFHTLKKRMSEVALEPTIASYGAAMSACDAAAAWTFAMNLLDEMLFLGPSTEDPSPSP